MTRRCIDCGVHLPADALVYVTQCKACYIAGRKLELARLREEVADLRGENNELRMKLDLQAAVIRAERDENNELRERMRKKATKQPPAIEPDMVRRLLQLVHPDKHANSEAATVCTQFLLALRTSAKGARA
jgi:integrase